jgi:hypothetical protein
MCLALELYTTRKADPSNDYEPLKLEELREDKELLKQMRDAAETNRSDTLINTHVEQGALEL